MTTEEEAKFDDVFGNEEEDPATRQQGATGKKPGDNTQKISFLFGVDARDKRAVGFKEDRQKSIQKIQATNQLCTTRRNLILKASREQAKKERLERWQQCKQQQEQNKGVDSRELKYKTACHSQEACC